MSAVYGRYDRGRDDVGLPDPGDQRNHSARRLSTLWPVNSIKYTKSSPFHSNPSASSVWKNRSFPVEFSVAGRCRAGGLRPVA